jgi:phosphate transport system protein
MKEKMSHLMEDIKKDLIFLAHQVEDAIFKALKALEKQDKKLAKEVYDLNKKIDIHEVQIEDHILSLLVLQQPVAVDLRFIVGALKMNNDLERIGDHAVNIAKIALKLLGDSYIKPLEDIPQMGKISRSMLHDSVHAFIDQNAELAREVCARDDEVDELYVRVREEVLEVLKKKSNKYEQGFDLISVAHELERVADLATNLAEDVVFMTEARIIRHGLDQK